MSHPATWKLNLKTPPGNLQAWAVCLAAGFFFFYEFFQLNVFDVINPFLRDFFHIDAASLSSMSSSYLLANVLFLLPAGVILDRFSVRWVIAGALSICVLGALGFALTTSFKLAMIFHFFAGLGNAFCFLSCVVLISRWFPPKRQAFVTGIIVTMAFLGGMVAHAPFVWLVDLWGFRQALLIDGFVGIALLMIIVSIVRDYPPHTKPPQNNLKTPVFLSLRQVLSIPATFFGGLYTSLMNLPLMVLCALWGVSYLETVHHLTSFQASSVSGMMFFGSMIGCPLAGWLSDHMRKRKPIMFVGALLTLPVIISLIYIQNLSLTMLFILFFLIGLLTSTQVISYPLVAESNAPKYTGVAVGMASVIVMGGAGFAQILFGVLMGEPMTLQNVYTAAHFECAMKMFIVATFLAVCSLFFIRETYCQPIND